MSLTDLKVDDEVFISESQHPSTWRYKGVVVRITPTRIVVKTTNHAGEPVEKSFRRDTGRLFGEATKGDPWSRTYTYVLKATPEEAEKHERYLALHRRAELADDVGRKLRHLGREAVGADAELEKLLLAVKERLDGFHGMQGKE